MELNITDKIKEFSQITVSNALKEHKIKKETNENQLKLNITRFKELSLLFKTNFSDLIEKISLLDSEKIGSKEEEEESPASIYQEIIPTFPNETYIYTKTGDGSHTVSCPQALPKSFQLSFKLNKITVGQIVIGVSDQIIDTFDFGYLGASFGEGNWGVAANNCCAFNGKWHSNIKGYKTGDILTINADDGYMKYAVNGEWEPEGWQMNDCSELFIAMTLTIEGNEVEIYPDYKVDYIK